MAKKIQSNKKRKARTQNAKSKQKRKLSIREASVLPGLNKKYFSKVKQEFHDIDYIHLLNTKDKKYLNSFMEETLNARFNHNGRKFVKTKAGKKKIYNENNARQRDVYSIARATGFLSDVAPEVALEEWQGKYINHNPEEMMMAEEDTEILTYPEYIKLKQSGAIIPDELRLYYETLYFDDFKLLKAKKS